MFKSVLMRLFHYQPRADRGKKSDTQVYTWYAGELVLGLSLSHYPSILPSTFFFPSGGEASRRRSKDRRSRRTKSSRGESCPACLKRYTPLGEILFRRVYPVLLPKHARATPSCVQLCSFDALSSPLPISRLATINSNAPVGGGRDDGKRSRSGGGGTGSSGS